MIEYADGLDVEWQKKERQIKIEFNVFGLGNRKN